MRSFSIPARCLCLSVITLCFFPISPAVAADAARLDKGALLKRLKSAEQTPWKSARFEGVRREEHHEPGPDPAEVEKEVARYMKKLETSIANGSFDVGDHGRAFFKRHFGTSDYTRLMDRPQVKAYFDDILARGERQTREAIDRRNPSHSTEGDFSCLLDADGRCRMVWTPTSAIWNGKPENHPEISKTTVVCNAERRIALQPGPMAYIQPGTSKNPLAAYFIVGGAKLLASGRASVWVTEFVTRSKSDDVAFTEDHQRASDLLRIVVKDGHGGQFYFELDVNKGYSVVRREFYQKGVLGVAIFNSNFAELSPGVWYPMKQSHTLIAEGQIKPEMQQRFDEGKLKVGSEELRSAQNWIKWDRNEYTFTSVKVNPPVAGADLMLTIPPGTRVTDWLNKTKEGPRVYTSTGKEP